MKQYASKSNEEIESIITFDNYEKKVNVYSTRNSTITKLIKSIGKPTNIWYKGNQIFDAEWNIPFSDRIRIRKVLSINNYFLNN